MLFIPSSFPSQFLKLCEKPDDLGNKQQCPVMTSFVHENCFILSAMVSKSLSGYKRLIEAIFFSFPSQIRIRKIVDLLHHDYYTECDKKPYR